MVGDLFAKGYSSGVSPRTVTLMLQHHVDFQSKDFPSEKSPPSGSFWVAHVILLKAVECRKGLLTVSEKMENESVSEGGTLPFPDLTPSPEPQHKKKSRETPV